MSVIPDTPAKKDTTRTKETPVKKDKPVKKDTPAKTEEPAVKRKKSEETTPVEPTEELTLKKNRHGNQYIHVLTRKNGEEVQETRGIPWELKQKLNNEPNEEKHYDIAKQYYPDITLHWTYIETTKPRDVIYPSGNPF